MREPPPCNRFKPLALDDADRTLVERIEAVASALPNTVAITDGRIQLTYAELDRAANYVAHGILERVGDGLAGVGLLLCQDVAGLVSLLGVLKAGKVGILLDRALPRERLRSVIQEARPELLLADDLDGDISSTVEVNTLPIPSAGAALAASRARPPDAVRSADDPSLVVYTSGSTGRPKGGAFSHRSTIHAAYAFRSVLGVSPDDRLSCFERFSVSAAKNTIFCALLNGATLCLYDLHQDGLSGLGQWLSRERITYYHSVPSVLRTLVQSLRGAELPSDLRIVRVGGDVIHPRDVAEVQPLLPPGCRVVNTYAGTETDVTALFALDSKTRLSGPFVPAGYPVEGKRITIHGEDGTECAPGDAGEIVVTSRYLPLGYWRQPGLTALTYTLSEDGSDTRSCRTGDIGRLTRDGHLEILGRLDERIKVRGYQVYPREIEQSLLQYPGVAEAHVVGRTEASREVRLVAYLSATSAPSPTVTQLRSFLAERLPPVMLPSAFVQVDRLPRLPNGKLDRAALPPPATGRPSLDAPYAPPRTELECEVARIWESELRVQSVGVTDRFADLGGDSLAAVAVMLRIEERLGHELPASSLLPSATVRSMAMLLETATAVASSPLVPIRATGTCPPIFCIHGMDGDVVSLVNLMHHLGSEQPVYGLRAPDPSSGATNIETQEALARCYVKAMREVLGHGPCVLVGYSLGAHVALSMAHLLRADGIDVSLLVVLDMAAPGSTYHEFRWHPGYFVTMARALPTVALSLLRLPQEQRRPYLRAETRKALNLGRDILSLSSRTRHRRSARAKYDDLTGRARRLAAWLDTLAPHPPAPYPGPVLVCRARAQPLDCSHTRLMDWDRLVTGSLEVCDVPGTHISMLQEPSVRTLARELSNRLARLSPPSSGSVATP